MNRLGGDLREIERIMMLLRRLNVIILVMGCRRQEGLKVWFLYEASCRQYGVGRRWAAAMAAVM